MTNKSRAAEEERVLATIKASTPVLLNNVVNNSLVVVGLQSHGVTLALGGGLSLEDPHPSGKRVHLDAGGSLVWPVLFLYPEFGQTDLVEAFGEDQTFEVHIEAMLGDERPPWDTRGQYTPPNVEVCGVR